MPNSLPPRPDLEQLRRRAKELVRAYDELDPMAVARVAAALPSFRDSKRPFQLSHAQAVIARENGFTSWPRLQFHIQALRAVGAALTPLPAARQPHLRTRPVAEIATVLTDLAGRRAFADLADGLAIERRRILRIRDLLVERGTIGILVDALLLGVRHENPALRYVFAHAMDIFADQRCAAALFDLLEDPVPRVRRIAVHSLACDDCKIDPLRAAQANSTDGAPRDFAGRVVALATSDPSVQVRRHATYALALFDDPRATQALQSLTNSPDLPTRRNAIAAQRRRRLEAAEHGNSPSPALAGEGAGG